MSRSLTVYTIIGVVPYGAEGALRAPGTGSSPVAALVVYTTTNN